MILSKESLAFRCFKNVFGKITSYVGPLSSAVAASDWGLYFGGVFDDCPYDKNIEVNHAGKLSIKVK